MPMSLDWESIFVLTVGVLLVAVSLTIHAAFMFLILRVQSRLRSGILASARGLFLLVPSILMATVFISLSCLLQITLWGQVLWHMGPFDSLREAMYFSSTTYTTLGTAKHVLVPPYRALEPMEATTGMLVSGLNTAILFAILASLGRKRSDFEEFFR